MELDVGGDGVEERMRTSSSFIQGGTKFSAVSGIGLCFGRVNDGTSLGSKPESVL